MSTADAPHLHADWEVLVYGILLCCDEPCSGPAIYDAHTGSVCQWSLHSLQNLATSGHKEVALGVAWPAQVSKSYGSCWKNQHQSPSNRSQNPRNDTAFTYIRCTEDLSSITVSRLGLHEYLQEYIHGTALILYIVEPGTIPKSGLVTCWTHCSRKKHRTPALAFEPRP